MTIEEAIEILETAPVLHVDDIYQQERTALRLGIEALEWIKLWREIPSRLPPISLPSESREEEG